MVTVVSETKQAEGNIETDFLPQVASIARTLGSVSTALTDERAVDRSSPARSLQTEWTKTVSRSSTPSTLADR